MPDDDSPDTKAERYHRFDTLLASTISRAAIQASRDIVSDAERILSTYAKKGGFSTRSEALMYLRSYIRPSDYEVLLARAQTLPEPLRTQWYTRLSTPAYRWRITNREAVYASTQMATLRARGYAREMMTGRARTVASDAMARTAYSVSKRAGMAIAFDMPNQRNLNGLLRKMDLASNVELFMDTLSTQYESLISGILSGKDFREISAEISARADMTPYKAKRFVRTTMTTVAAEGEIAEARSLDIKRLRFTCTFDEKTCPVCSALDGTEYDADDPDIIVPGPEGTHWNCRCSLTPVIPKGYGEGRKRFARDSEGRSIRVSGDMSFDEYSSLYIKE
ncbi:MAG: minor capsid protein [Gudongella sp.]|jgi:SPP1 gp7 family putative phage head morphogenesis protein|nr:minor capsid protein [Gudongella sp.]